MPDQLDARIRALVREVVDSAPSDATVRGHRMRFGGRSVVRRRVTPRARVIAAIAACVVVALVIGGVLVFPGSDEPQSVQSPAGQPTRVRSGVCGQGLRQQPGRRHGVGDHDGDGCGVGTDHRR